ncbi:MAG: hypothetical protein V1843_00430, partial [bacterium]
FIVPMAYGKNTASVSSQIMTAARTSGNRYVLAGLGAYYNSADSLIAKVRNIDHRSENSYLENIKGFVLFSYDGMRDNHWYWEKLRATIFQNPVDVPVFPWKEAAAEARGK